MLELKNIFISIDDRYLIKNLSFVLNKGDKLAIIGEEGNGKSTLLKSILGLCNYANITGSINLKNNRIGYLEQTMNNKYMDYTVKDYLFENDEDYYNKITNFYTYLNTFNFDDIILNQRINTLSGGEKVKISLLKILMNDPDILFLDEPTNDLDVETLEWLESFINNTSKPIIYISHDETLLSNTANTILHLEQINKKTDCRHTLIKIGYDEYVNQRINLINKQTQIAKSEKREHKKKEEKLRNVLQKVEYQQDTISRANPHGAKMLKRKMKTLKSQEAKLNNENLTKIPNVEECIYFNFDNTYIPSKKEIIKLHLDELNINNKILSRNINLNVTGRTHICITGKNGIGKSTLIKKIYEELKIRSDIKVGYMPQSYEDILSEYINVLDFICNNGNREEITKARIALGNMKFTSNEMIGKINNLSNGAKAKLFLIKLVLDECNVLILDEPTRNVSPLSNPVIRNVLKNFQGTIISVSHDRKFIAEVINELYILTSNGLIKSKV